MTTAINSIGKLNSKKIQNSPFWQTENFQNISVRVIALVLFITLLTAGSWKIALASTGKIFPRVTVAGLKVGGKSPAEAKKMVESYINTINNQGPEISYTDKTIKPTLNEMGLTFEVDKVIDEAYQYGRHGTWKDRFLENAKMALKGHQVVLNPTINDDKLNQYLGQVAQVVEVKPQNASLKTSNGEVLLTSAQTGRGLDKDQLKKDLTTLINTNKLNSKVNLSVTELKPDILDEGTVNAKETAEKFMASAPIYVTYNDQTFTADRAEIGSWLSFNPEGDELIVTVSPAKVAVFTGWVASKIEVKKIDKEVMDGTGEVLNEGQDGLGVDTSRLTNDVHARVQSASNGSPITVATYLIPKGQITKNPHAQPGRYPGKYIDINLSEQTLYAFEGSKLVNQFLVSTGKTGPTPQGEFSVYAKTRSQVMDGPGYYLPNVEWISWWSGDYSIHGTYWHNNFGHPMSHGCVNASNSDAQWIYNWDEVGTPVYIHG